MTVDAHETELTTLAPNDAFAVLGNETRMAILQLLGEADGSLPFSELRAQVGMRDPGQFNYHLKQLLGHFVRQTDDGYTLSRAGERVVMAVLSGAVTDDPEVEPTSTDLSCWYCGAPIEVSYRQERATAYCTECKGAYGASVGPEKRTRLGYMYLPPAGIKGRTPAEVYLAALTWRSRDILAWANGICPHCSAPLENGVRICDDHDATDGLCDKCDRRYGVEFHTQCTNCIFEMNAMFMAFLLANTNLRAFLLYHGFDPFSPSPEQYAALYPYDEEVLRNEPFKARFTFTIDDDYIILTVDENLDVVEVTRG
jgi:hypothetical protein